MPTILVYPVTICNWLLNCTTGIFTSFYCFWKFATSAFNLVVFELFIYYRPILAPENARNRLAAALCAPPEPRAGFKGWIPENWKGGEGMEGERIDTPNFWNVAVSLVGRTSQRGG